MSFPARWIAGTAVAGDFDSDSAGTTDAGEILSTANIAAGSLSCLFVVDAETNTITLAGKWQVSDDRTTWYDMAPSNNAATVVLATGTAGADATVSKALPAPEQVLGWKYVRPACETGVTTGTTSDTYSMSTRYRRFNGFS